MESVINEAVVFTSEKPVFVTDEAEYRGMITLNAEMESIGIAIAKHEHHCFVEFIVLGLASNAANDFLFVKQAFTHALTRFKADLLDWMCDNEFSFEGYYPDRLEDLIRTSGFEREDVLYSSFSEALEILKGIE